MHLSDSIHSFLFLGDSYTIGEGLPLEDSYPYQTIQLLRQAGHGFYAPEIIARTGWTTDELTAAIRRTTLLPAYAYAALLIGVNNQYRGRSAVEYGTQFEQLLLQTLALTGDARRVFVLSIPDWGVSPFAAAAAPSPGPDAMPARSPARSTASIPPRSGSPAVTVPSSSISPAIAVHLAPVRAASPLTDCTPPRRPIATGPPNSHSASWKKEGIR